MNLAKTLVLLAGLFLSLGTAAPAFAAPTPLPPQKKVLELVEKLRTGAPDERVAAAQSLAELGSKASKAVPALVESLASDEPMLVEATVEALVAIGKKAREPLVEVLQSGKYEETEVPRGRVARALIPMGKAGKDAVDEYVASAEPGPELFSMFEEFGDGGATYLVQASTPPDHRVHAMRSLRRLAAKAPRDFEAIAKPLGDIEDKDVRMAVMLTWTQTPTDKDVSDLRRWLHGDRPALTEAALWLVGLLGADAQAAATDVAAHLDSNDPLVRRTALWALSGLGTPGAALPDPEIPASFPGAAKDAEKPIEEATNNDVFLLWRDAAKSLGYRGRISMTSRKLWALAPTWTNQVEHLPADVDRTKLATEFLAIEPKLIELLSSDDLDTREYASTTLASMGCTDEKAHETWVAWLESDDALAQRAALVGLLPAGRKVIAHQELIIAALEDERTLLAAARLLTKIATPTGWRAVTARVAELDGKTPLPLLITISRYDKEALRPMFDRMSEQYRKGSYLMAALLLRFEDEAVPIFQSELGSNLADRRMVAAESLGHLGALAKPALPTLQKMKERHAIAQQLLTDAIARIK